MNRIDSPELGELAHTTTGQLAESRRHIIDVLMLRSASSADDDMLEWVTSLVETIENEIEAHKTLPPLLDRSVNVGD